MSTLAPTSFSFKSAEKPQTTALAFHTPAFNKEPDHSDNDDDIPTRKKVVCTPKLGVNKRNSSVSYRGSVSTHASTSCGTSSTCSVRTSYKEDADTHPAKDVKKSLSTVLDMTPSTMNKKKDSKAEGEVKAPKYGKRKIQYIDTEDEEFDDKENFRQTRTGAKKQVKANVPIPHQVSKLYLYNHSKTQMYCFPVYEEKDLKYNVEVQKTLRETEIDNDCDTENEILEYSIYQAKKDLAKGILMQREEEELLKKTLASSQQMEKNECVKIEKKERNKSEEKVNKGQQNDFWTNVKNSFIELIGQDSRKSI